MGETRLHRELYFHCKYRYNLQHKISPCDYFQKYQKYQNRKGLRFLQIQTRRLNRQLTRSVDRWT